MKKLSLKELKVKSFVTKLSGEKVQTVKGGKTAGAACGPTEINIATLAATNCVLLPDVPAGGYVNN